MTKLALWETFCDGCLLCSRICRKTLLILLMKTKAVFMPEVLKMVKWFMDGLLRENTGKIVSKVREKAKQIAKEFGIKTIIIDGPPGIGCSAW